jgi:tRNA(adenine34) deaminase
MSREEDEHFMRVALETARLKGEDPSLSPIGCCIVLDGHVIATEANHVAEHRDATAHAEIETIRVAGREFEDGELRGAVLYSTLQPCGMCTMASIWAKVSRIVYGAGREDVHRMYFEARHINTLSFVGDAYRDDLTIEGGVLKDLCAKLYYRPGDDVPLSEQGNL